MSPPRPILKRSPRKVAHVVHFPPSPVLTRACLAHSPSSYDRTPISVEENECALPERGCPGRTYTLCEADELETRLAWEQNKLGLHPMGRTFHPRSMQKQSVPLSATCTDVVSSTGTDRNLPATQANIALPPLVPDTSSSETEESDSLASPPHQFAAFRPGTASRAKGRSAPTVGTATFPLRNDLTGERDVSALSFLPHAPDGIKPRRRRDSKVRIPPPETSSTEEMAEEGTADETDTDGCYRRLELSTSLSTCRLDDGDEGCLAGF